MIITYSKHGRTSRDSAKLVAHLLKPENEKIEILEIGGSVARDIAGVVKDMELLRNGCRGGSKAAFHHLSCNPSIDYSDEQFLRATQALRRELDWEGTRPFITIIHTKRGRRHGHLLIGHSDGYAALKDHQSKIRSEVVARCLEQAEGEVPVRSRHAKQVDKILRQRGLDNVADWILATHGEQLEPPRSNYGSKSRERAKRAGLNLPVMKAAIAHAWSSATNLQDFKENLKAVGLKVQPGKKQNVWAVVDETGRTVGALDRLLRLKRRVVQNMMEGQHGQFEEAKRQSSNDHRSRTPPIRANQSDRRANRGDQAPFGPDGAADVRARPHQADLDATRKYRNSEFAPAGRDADSQRQAGRGPVSLGHRRALITLRRVGRGIDLQALNNVAQQLPRIPGLTDIWGIPIEPPRYRP
jgi:hypothetical protein